jgi:hypothetical protein
MSTSLIYPNGFIEPRPRLEVKVQRLARPPAPWLWSIHVEGQPKHLYIAKNRYSSAQEAWEAGRKALIVLERGRRPPRPTAAQHSK